MATEVKIAQFKNRLSHYLRAVRKGAEIVIKDRDEPVARVVPYKRPGVVLNSIPPTISLKEADKLFDSLPRPSKLKPGDVDKALRWVRRDRLRDIRR